MDKQSGASRYVEMCMKKYGKKTIEDRAIPELRDGLKPVQRRIIWTMHKLNLKASFVKSARVVGACFAAGTPVSTPTGKVPIEKLKIGDLVETSQGPRKVIATFANPPAQVAKVKLVNGAMIVLTLEQEVKIKIGDKFYWKEASQLTPDDVIVVESE